MERRGSPAGWYVRIGDANIALPSAREVAEQDYYATPDAITLLRVKDRILEEMAGYLPVVGNPMTGHPADHAALREALLLGLSPL